MLSEGKPMVLRQVYKMPKQGDRSLRVGREILERGLLEQQQNYSDWQNVSFLFHAIFGERLRKENVQEFAKGHRLIWDSVAKRKTLFDDRPVEISELTYVIKQDLASLNQQIASLQALTQSQHPKSNRSKTDQEGEHNDNVSDSWRTRSGRAHANGVSRRSLLCSKANWLM